MHSDFGRLGVSEHSTVEICAQKGGQGPLIGAKPNTMHNSELCTNQRTLHLDCFQISANFAIWVSPEIFPNFSRSEDSAAAAAAAANEIYALLLLVMLLLLLKNLGRGRELL